MGKNITVLGAGAWGTAFGQVLADAGNTVTMWAKEQRIVEDIRDRHHNAVRLPSVEKLPDNMTATGDRAEAVKNADIVVVAIAAQFARVKANGIEREARSRHRRQPDEGHRAWHQQAYGRSRPRIP